MSRPRITGKVVAVVTSRAIVINKGQLDGVSIGTRFAVQIITGPITDPEDPANNLNNLSFTKGKLIINTLFPRMAYGLLEGIPANPLPELRPTPMTYPSTIAPLIAASDWSIKVGDVVEEIFDETRK
jgi:hypothetical protein